MLRKTVTVVQSPGGVNVSSDIRTVGAHRGVDRAERHAHPPSSDTKLREGARVTDAGVIGSGPNGLTAANMLADEGWAVTVIEDRRRQGAVRTRS